MRFFQSFIGLLIWSLVSLQNTPAFMVELNAPVSCSMEMAAESGMEMCCSKAKSAAAAKDMKGCCDEICNPNAIWLQSGPAVIELKQIEFKSIETSSSANYQAWCPNPFLETAVPPPDFFNRSKSS